MKNELYFDYHHQIDKEIGQRIASRRVALGMSQAELARKLSVFGISRVMVNRWEIGSTSVRACMVLPLAYALLCSAAYLLGEHQDAM